MDAAELEHWAREIRGIARLRDDELLTGPEIAARMVGASNIVLVAGSGAARSEGRRIIVPREHPDFSFAFVHECAEIVLEERTRFVGSHIEKERAANYIGSATLTPRPTVARAHAHFGQRTQPLAEVFGVTRTLIRLRLGEVMGIECGLVTSEHEHTLRRNPAQIDWDDPEIKDFAMNRGKYADPAIRYPGLAKTTPFRSAGIDNGRVALRVTLKRRA